MTSTKIGDGNTLVTSSRSNGESVTTSVRKRATGLPALRFRAAHNVGTIAAPK